MKLDTNIEGFNHVAYTAGKDTDTEEKVDETSTGTKVLMGLAIFVAIILAIIFALWFLIKFGKSS